MSLTPLSQVKKTRRTESDKPLKAPSFMLITQLCRRQKCHVRIDAIVTAITGASVTLLPSNGHQFFQLKIKNCKIHCGSYAATVDWKVVSNIMNSGRDSTDISSRPKTIDDVSAQEHTIAVLQKSLTSTNVSRLLEFMFKTLNITSFLICFSMDLQEQERPQQS